MTEASGAPLVLGIDVGTQSAKVAVHDADGTLVAHATRALRPLDTPRRGVAEHPDDDLWVALCAASQEAMADLESRGGRRDAVVAVGLCGIRNCQALLREDGLLAAPVQSWMDDRASSPQGVDPQARWVTSSSAYLTGRLTGQVADSVAAFRGRWPVDLERWRWSDDPEVLASCGIAPEQLVDLVLPGEVLGRLTPDAAAATGLPAGLPVVATANDKAVEALGCGLLAPGSGDVLVSLGTYAAGMVVGTEPRTDLTRGWTNFAAVPGRYLHESTGVRRGMATVSWVRHVTGAESVEALDALAAQVPRGADGLLAVLDWLAPVDAPHRRGAFVGLDSRHGPEHLLRAVMEAMAMTLHRHVTALEAELGTTSRRLLLSGGGSRSRLAPSVFADVFARPVATFGLDSPAARGAAVLAAVAAGLHPSHEAAVAVMVPAPSVVAPDPAGVEHYAGLEAIHRRLPERLDPVLRELHDLTGDA